MLRDQALLLKDVQSQTLLHWAQVWVRDSASICFREKTKKLLELREQEMAGQLGSLATPLNPQPHPSPDTHLLVLMSTLYRGNFSVHRLQAQNSDSSLQSFSPSVFCKALLPLFHQFKSCPPAKAHHFQKAPLTAPSSELQQPLLPDQASKCS